MNIKLRRNYWF